MLTRCGKSGSLIWVMPPGKNQKRYVAGALAVDGSDLIYVAGDRKNTALFIALLEKLREKHPGAKRIHLILDNCSTHSSKILQKYLAKQDGFFVLHLLPPYCPNDNKIERLAGPPCQCDAEPSLQVDGRSHEGSATLPGRRSQKAPQAESDHGNRWARDRAC